VSEVTPKIFKALHQAIQNKLIRSAHDISEGGLAVTIAEMCIGGRLGAALEFDISDVARTLFGETTGCLLVEVVEDKKDEFLALFNGLPIRRIGSVMQDPILTIRLSVSQSVSLPIAELVHAWNQPLQSEVVQ
jgi:phosphoribosylformylglycinamidine synthase